MAGELNQPWQNQANQNQWWSGQQQGATGGNMYGQPAVQQPARTQPPTSGYGSYSVPAQQTPTFQPAAPPAQQPAPTTQPAPTQQPSQQFSINWGGATSVANRIGGYENKIKNLEERMRTAPRTAQETARMNQDLANMRERLKVQKQQLMNMGGGAAEFFQDNQQGLSDFFGAARQQYQTGPYAHQLNQDQNMLWNLLSQGAQSWQPPQEPAWQGTPWQQW